MTDDALQRLWDAKASRREVDAFGRMVERHGERIDELADGKADKADVRDIREDVNALRRAIVGGSISICIVIASSAAAYFLWGPGHP